MLGTSVYFINSVFWNAHLEQQPLSYPMPLIAANSSLNSVQKQITIISSGSAQARMSTPPPQHFVCKSFHSP